MYGLQQYSFTDEDGERAVQFAREALETYIKEDQRMDVGSVEDRLNKRTGVLLQLESEVGRARTRGSAAVYDDSRLADSLIDATVHAASNRSVGSAISQSEMNSVRFRIALIERVTVTDTPEEEITIGTDCPIILSSDSGWLYPLFAKEQNWNAKQYLDRTCRKASKVPTEWEDHDIVVAKTAPFIETEAGSGFARREEQ